MIKYIATSRSGEGLITHEDQEVRGLSFEVLAYVDGVHYVKVSGEEAAITQWAARVAGIDVDQSDVEQLLVSLSRIDRDVEQRLADLEIAIASLLGM